LVANAAGVLAQEVEATTVHFNAARAPLGAGANGTWMEADVVLTVRPPPGVPNQMLSRVKVALLLGFELPAPAGGERRIEHYRSEVEAVALDAGRADIRFYLPPELVKRDQLHGDPKYWGVELAVAGRSVAAAKTAYSTSLATADARRNFQTRGGSAAAPNDGILLPQYLTPFANEYPRATPSFVRREAR
jgi:hypothetical protein